MYEQIVYDVTGRVATITLNRPERLNALTYLLLAEVRHALAQAESDERVTGIILTGEGRGFSAGMDAENLAQDAGTKKTRQDSIPSELDATPGDPQMGDDFQVTFGYLLSVRKPVIAAINGPCAGLGMAIACLCDLRFAAPEAVFRTAFAQRGLIAEHGMSWILPRLVGPSHALDLLWHPRKVRADEAREMGLVNRVVARDELVAEARRYLEEVAESCAPVSIMIMKQQVYRALMQPLGEAMHEANGLMATSLAKPDFREGVASFTEKRAPKFSQIKA